MEHATLIPAYWMVFTFSLRLFVQFDDALHFGIRSFSPFLLAVVQIQEPKIYT